jgi:hypothetical protein
MMSHRVLFTIFVTIVSLASVRAFQNKTPPAKQPAQTNRALNVREVASGLAPDGKGQLGRRHWHIELPKCVA